MRVTLLAFGILRDELAPTTGAFDVPAGSTVGDLLQRCRALAPRSRAPWSSIAVAVNQEYVPASHPLADGDEVALLPPVSGGSAKKSSPPPGPPSPIQMVTVERRRVFLTEDAIDASMIAQSLSRGEDGAVVTFDGIVRNNTHGRRTLYLIYEAYPEMALAQMKLLAARAFADFPVRDLAIVHRLGRIEIGETSVAIVVASAHRSSAFEACRWLIDTLKTTVPIWKKEFFEDGAVWAQGDPFPADLTPSAPRRSSARASGAPSGSSRASRSAPPTSEKAKRPAARSRAAKKNKERTR